MRKAVLALAVLILAATSLPAEAAWKSYISRPFGFAFEAPGEVKAEKGLYHAAVGGTNNPASIYRSVEDNIEYRATVVDFSKRAAEGSVLMEEAAFILQDGKRMLMNDFGRVQTGADGVYGRKMTFDMPNNGGRKSVAVYFTKGHLYVMEATVLPANGDYASPDPGRFLDSLVFILSFAEPGATELAIPK
jgi:hypothetical protein